MVGGGGGVRRRTSENRVWEREKEGANRDEWRLWDDRSGSSDNFFL